MVGSLESGFDFDEWCCLARSDPAAFEAARDRAIRTLIQQMSEQQQQRLTGLQWRIDTVRAMAPNSTASFLRLSDMMWGSFYQQQAMLKSLLEPAGRGSRSPDIQAKTTNVVPFTQIS